MKTLHFPLNRQTAADVSNLRFLHRRVMAEYAQLPDGSASPRRDLGVLFRVCFPGEPFGKANAVTVISRDQHPQVTAGEQLRIAVRIAAERRSDAGTRPVRDDEADVWATAKLEAAGFTVHRLAVGPERTTGKGSLRFTSRDLQAEVTIRDEPLANHAMAAGIGRGKNYGLGMVLTL